MILAEAVPASGERIETDSPDALAWLSARYAPPAGPWVRLNMVTALTGSAVGADGTSDTLTSRVDRRILGLIRASADAVVVGAETVRVEGYTVPRGPVVAVVTVSGDLSGARFDDAPAGRVLVLCPAGRAQDVARRNPGRHIVPVAGGDTVDPAAARAALASRGLARLVCEGGPTLASQWSDAGLIDEYCVSVAPALGAQHPPFLRLTHPPATVVAGALAGEDGFSFLRLRRASSAPAA